ncbi:MAG: efflux RND transporter periplasmic adaptor subunit [Saprospiraceae bacterium]|nr:efflux RND transporter periplasmic adaptor subunit [Candidatus Vicinibacter affinis]MBK9643323.1 efflux RND transporter periplasmic adaptor subunit [Candidatus Vicinibacter affinis]
MNTKKKLSSIGFFALLLLFTVLSSCKNKHENHQQVNEHGQHSNAAYACPMKCEGDKTYPSPGNCPICKMKLVLIEEELIQSISPGKQVLSRQATVKLQSGINGDIIIAQGYITTDPNRNKSVAARFSGRIEKLYVKFSNQYVNQGDKIMNIYSPNLRTFQEEHLFILKSNNENSLIEKSREKLRLLGITDNQITQLEKNGTVALTIPVYSPANGYVFFSEQSQQQNAGTKNNPAMNTMNMKQNANNESSYDASASQIREGMYVNEGQKLFSVNDLQEVWALVSVANQYLNQIHENQSVEIIAETNPSKPLKGKVALIEQTFEEASQRFARVRIVLPNSNNLLKINSLVTAQFTISKSKSKNMQVPSSAVYKTGLNAFVWVKTDTTQNGTGIFQLRKVIAGTSANGMITIQSGLTPNEEIAKEAGLMTDSETFLNEN